MEKYLKYNTDMLEFATDIRDIDIHGINIKYDIISLIKQVENEMNLDKRYSNTQYTVLNIGYKTKHIVLIEHWLKTTVKLYTVLMERNKYKILSKNMYKKINIKTKANIIKGIKKFKSYYYSNNKKKVKFMFEKTDLKEKDYDKTFHAIYVEIETDKKNQTTVTDLITGEQVLLTEEIWKEYNKGPDVL